MGPIHKFLTLIRKKPNSQNSTFSRTDDSQRFALLRGKPAAEPAAEPAQAPNKTRNASHCCGGSLRQPAAEPAQAPNTTRNALHCCVANLRRSCAGSTHDSQRFALLRRKPAQVLRRLHSRLATLRIVAWQTCAGSTHDSRRGNLRRLYSRLTVHVNKIVIKDYFVNRLS